jgi:hypothetical protein
MDNDLPWQSDYQGQKDKTQIEISVRLCSS